MYLYKGRNENGNENNITLFVHKFSNIYTKTTES